ncbi:carboxypeptidase-like regulatory domain-containing protein [Paucihalobacter ruber]|uniref:Carboxypeptidase-like regulatory domain-containing protein n=1 Tax=Paucihalobacter ruber TaxID=2567861 RepID=A0A506PN77_9FLAO|nr:carboxypeptidase-like regulatory domain-containing protein [Paucihalobacter ruber]TPV34675.1 carboxypeptidase-like regulatory domain-containing protein [Paucihalobacter ruber]
MQCNYVPILLFWIVSYAFGQNSVEGYVKDINNTPLSGALVSLKKLDTTHIINYTVSDANGYFKLILKSTEQELQIDVSFLGFETESKIITNTNQTINFILLESEESLREVIIKAFNIEKRSDTLSYSVSQFKDLKDRTIADVMKKMPGIEILPNGQIYYMGNPIEKYYIEGLDMLEGRYNLANDNISADDVSKVEILENHQPIRVLDSLISSERTSLNIKLKNNTTVTGTAKMGAGFSPLLFETNITPLLFKKNSQSLLSYQYNNTGNDLLRNNNDFSVLNSQLNDIVSSQNLLAIRPLSQPPLKSQLWLDNKDHFFSINHLYRLKNKTELKLNVAYFNGDRTENGARNTAYFTANDTISFREDISNKIYRSTLNTKLIVEKNSDKNFIKNVFNISSLWNTERGVVNNNSTNINQRVKNPLISVSNQLEIIKPFGKQLVNFNSVAAYLKTDESLMVKPGQFNQILNNSESFEQNRQNVATATFYTQNTIGLTKKVKSFTISPEMGFDLKNENLSSSLFKLEDQALTSQDIEFQNDLSMLNSNIFIKKRIQFKNNKWLVVLDSPFLLRYFNINNQISNNDQNLTRFNYEPSLTATKKLLPYWEVGINAGIKNNFGGLNSVYDGFILKNYLTLLRYNSILSEQRAYSTRFNIGYRDALNAIFTKLSIALGENQNNLLFNNFIADDGSLIVETFEQNNKSSFNRIELVASKYFNNIKTTVNATGRYSLNKLPQIVNGDLVTFTIPSQSYKLNIESNINKIISLSAESLINLSKIRSETTSFSSIKNWENTLNVFFYFSNRQYLNFEFENYFNKIGDNTNNNTFLNLSYQLTINKPKLDTKISWTNILNTNDYISLFNNQFSTNANVFVLRPSQLLLSVQFSL